MKETMMNEVMELTMNELEQVNGGAQDVTLKGFGEKIKDTSCEPDTFPPIYDSEPFGPRVNPSYDNPFAPYINRLYAL